MNFFDLHCDTAYEIFKNKTDFKNSDLAVNFNDNLFEKWRQNFAFWIKDDCENPFLFYKNMLSYFKEKIKSAPKNLDVLISVEGAALLQEDTEKIHILKEDGVKFLSLCWNGETCFAGGANTDKGLTKTGKNLIKQMNNLKIACDLSHLNRKSFWAALENSDFPLATHSNCYEICPHKRNLKSEQIKAIYEKKGIIGLCFYPEFLKGDVFEKIYENIFLLCEKGYDEIICIGTDFDGAEMAESLNGIEKIPDLYIFLKNKGLKEGLLRKFFYQNADKFIAKL